MAVVSRSHLILFVSVLAIGGIGTGLYFAVKHDGGNDEQIGVVATSTSTSTLARPSPTSPPTQLPPTEVPPTLIPTPDTRVAIRDLPTRDQIQLGADGKYFIADRGDGCRWIEHSRVMSPDVGETIVLSTDCPVDFGITYRPATGEIFALVS